MPEDVGQFRDSFRVGWREADDQITIASRQNDKVSYHAENASGAHGKDTNEN